MTSATCHCGHCGASCLRWEIPRFVIPLVLMLVDCCFPGSGQECSTPRLLTAEFTTEHTLQTLLQVEVDLGSPCLPFHCRLKCYHRESGSTLRLSAKREGAANQLRSLKECCLSCVIPHIWEGEAGSGIQDGLELGELVASKDARVQLVPGSWNHPPHIVRPPCVSSRMFCELEHEVPPHPSTCSWLHERGFCNVLA